MKVDLHLDQATYQRLDDHLADRVKRAEHVTPALNEISDDFLDIQRRRFLGAAGWVPLSAKWAVEKARGGRPITPLAGGELEASLTRKGARFAVRKSENRTVTLGTSDPVAHLHRDGTKRMPRRPPVSISQADEQRWVEIFRQHLGGSDVGRGL